MPSALEIIAPDALFITFPLSDGEISRRPDNMKAPSPSAKEVNWHRKMTMDERYVCRWRNLIGQGIAKLLNKPEKEKYSLGSFPEGYWMFDHNKGPTSNVRHDLYLFGSRTVVRFRSPAEFIPHGYWLLTDPTLSTSNCGCKYCGGNGKKTQTQISEALGLPTNRGSTAVNGSTRMRIGLQRPSKPVRTSAATGALPVDTPWVPKASRQSRKIDPVWRTSSLRLQLTASNIRVSDLTSSRKYRVGEIVWCAIEPLAEGSLVGKFPQLWPAIVLDFSLESTVEGNDPKCFAYSVHQKRTYSLLRLGAFSEEARVQFHCIVNEDAILPWHAYGNSLKIATADNQPGVQFSRAMSTANHLIRFWAVCNRLSIKIRGASQKVSIPQEDGQTLFGKANGPLQSSKPSRSSTPYIQSSLDTLPQRSPVRLAPPTPRKTTTLPFTNDTHTSGSSQSSVPPKGFTNTNIIYEGIWYGAERIWVGDVVRLRPERASFTPSLRLCYETSGDTLWQQKVVPSPGAEMRCVFLRVERIFSRAKDTGSKECVISGQLYELAPDCWTGCKELARNDQRTSASAASRLWDSATPTWPWDISDIREPGDMKDGTFRDPVDSLDKFALPSPPQGCVFRPLLPAGSEFPVPISLVAGRYYSNLFGSPLLDSTLQQMPKDISSFSLSAASEIHGIEILSLCGLAPGRFNHATCADIRLSDRIRMVEEAISLAQTESMAPNTAEDMDIVSYANL